MSAITLSNPKLQRTIARFEQKVASQDYYEAHQTLRSLINRAVKGHQTNHAIDLIYHGLLILMEHNQFVSALDLIFYLFEVLGQESIYSLDILSKVLTLVSKFPVEDPSFKKVSLESVSWLVLGGKYPFGDPNLHDLLGHKLVTETITEAKFTQAAQAASGHFLVGTAQSLPALAELCWLWYEDSGAVELLGLPVLDFLVLQNVKSARQLLETFLTKLEGKYTPLKVDDFAQIAYFEGSLELLNFVQLVILTVQVQDKDMFVRLKTSYKAGGLEGAVAKIGGVYFGLRAPKQVNFLQEMMSGLMK